MKFRMTFKTPDELERAVREAVLEDNPGWSEEELEEEIQEQVSVLEERFFKYRELVTIQIDTKEGTATVVPN